MAHASNANSRLGIIAETVIGTTPATPTFDGQQFDTFSLTASIEELLDPSKSDVRGYTTSVQGNKTHSGTIEGPLAPANYDKLMQVALYGTFTSDILKLGNTIKSLSIEESIPDADTPFFKLYNGVIGNGMTINAPSNGLCTISIPIMALGETVSTTSASTAPYNAVVQEDPFTHCAGVITEGGSPIAYVTGVTLTVAQNTNTNFVWGSCNPDEYSLGRPEVTGSLQVFIVDPTLYNKYKNNTSTSLSFTLTSGTKSLQFTLPSVKYTSGEMAIASGSAPRSLTLNFRAFYDATLGSEMSVTRALV